MATGSSTTGVDLGLTQKIQSVGRFMKHGAKWGSSQFTLRSSGMGKEGLVVTSGSQDSVRHKQREGRVLFVCLFLLRIGRAHSIGVAWRSSWVDDPERLFTSSQHSEQRTQRNQSWLHSDLLPR